MERDLEGETWRDLVGTVKVEATRALRKRGFRGRIAAMAVNRMTLLQFCQRVVAQVNSCPKPESVEQFAEWAMAKGYATIIEEETL